MAGITAPVASLARQQVRWGHFTGQSWIEKTGEVKIP